MSCSFVLLTLSQHLVATEHWPTAIGEQILRRTCAAFKEMGIESNDTPHDELGTPYDRALVFWALYCHDKQRAFHTGKACDLYSFDCGHRLPTVIANQQQSATHAAKAHLMSLWEGIWTALYSAKALHAGHNESMARIAHLTTKLKAWFEQFHHVLEQVKSTQLNLTPLESLKLELQYL